MGLGLPFFSTFGVKLYYISYLSTRIGGANSEQVGRGRAGGRFCVLLIKKKRYCEREGKKTSS